MQKQFGQKTIYVIDGSSFLYRAYYGVRPLHTTHGVPIQAVFSFCRMIKHLINQFDPHYIAIAWDSKGPTVRHEMYKEYKATRQEAPSDLFVQKKYIQEFADLIELRQYSLPGIEADDIMYTIAKDHKDSAQIVLVTSDKDMGQVISDSVVMYDPFKNTVIDKQTFEQERGFPVEKLPFYFAILGDASDNIPGVKGIGKKGALDLVQQFNSLTDLYAHLDNVPKERTRTLLAEQKDNAFLSYELFLLRHYTIDDSLKNLAFDKKNWAHAYPLFKELEFKSLMQEIEKEQGVTPPPVPTLSEKSNYTFVTVTTAKDLEKLCAALTDAQLCGIDTELDGLDPLSNTLVGISVCYAQSTAYYIPFGHTTGEPQLSRVDVLTALKPILENPQIKKVMHHAKFDMLALWHYGIDVQGLVFDTLIAAHLVTQDWQRVNLKYLSEFYLHEKMLTFAEVVTSKGYETFAEVPIVTGTEYAASDAHQTLQLYPLLQKELAEKQMEKLYYDIEHPLIRVLFDMEREGIVIDEALLAKLDIQVSKQLDDIKLKIATLVGEKFETLNLNSPKQLKELLFEHLGLPPQKKTAGKTGHSTDQEVLETLAKIHPVPGLILQYRTLFKLKSTYIDALPTHINPETHKIHTSFSQTAVATGRLASSEPNLQNIPVDSPAYKGISLRSVFKPDAGDIFISADYSQIELRVLAYLSQDATLLHAFKNNVDIHAETASKLFDVPLAQVSNEQRQLGKRINFSILYGLTPYGLAQDLRIPFGKAKEYIEKYFAQYPGVSAWMEQVIEETKKYGYVTTHWGRRRYIPGIYEKNRTLYDLACRIAINTKAQGTAAELMKLGMIQVAEYLKQHHPDAQLVLQIHDELLLSASLTNYPPIETQVRDILQNVVQWNVPLVVTTRHGADWQEVTK